MSKNNTSKTSISTSRTDWEKVDSLQDKDLDLSEHPEISPEQFVNAVVREGLKPVKRNSRTPANCK